MNALMTTELENLELDVLLVEDSVTDAEPAMTTVAEGVETQGQLDYLRRAGCDESQGYLHSRPVPGVEFEQFLLKVNAVPEMMALDLPEHRAKS
jgi:sensor c-di-GMP phosphodiesterase-like protein